MSRNITRTLRAVLLLALAALVLAACGGGDDETDNTPVPEATVQPTAPPVPPTATSTPRPTPLPQPVTDSNPRTGARLRVIHASPDLPAINIFLDGANIGRGFTYGLYHNAPLSYVPGTYTLRVVAAGDDPDIAPPLITEELTLTGGESRLAVLTGPPDDPQLVLALEDISPIPTGSARLNTVNAVTGGDDYAVQEANQTLIADVAPGATGEDQLLAAERHTFDFTAGVEILHSVDLNLSEQVTYTLILAGDAAAETYTVIDVRSEAEKETQVRFIQASLDMPPVDVYLDDLLLGEALDYRDVLDWQTLPSYTYRLRLVPAGETDADPIFTRNVALNPNEALSLIALDSVERLRLIELEEETEPTPTNGVRLAFVQAALGVDTVTIETLGGPVPGLRPLTFGSISNPVMLATGETAFYIATDDPENPVTVDYIAPREWSAGTQYLVVITNDAENEPLVLTQDVGTEQTILGDSGEIVPLASGDDATPAPGEDAGFAQQLRIRAVNVLADSGPIDILFDDEPVFEDIVFGAATVYVSFSQPPTRVTLRASANDIVLLENDLPLAGIADLTLFVYRDGDAITYEITPDIATSIAGGQARLRIAHFAPGKPAYYLGYQRSFIDEDNPTPVADEAEIILLVEPVDAGAIGEPQTIEAGTYDAQLREANTDILQTTIDLRAESGQTYDLILLPDASALGITPIVIAHR